MPTSGIAHDNVDHPLQNGAYDTVFRYNPALHRAEYFSWGQAAWDSVSEVFTSAPESKPRTQARELRGRGRTMTTYGKTYLEPIVED